MRAPNNTENISDWQDVSLAGPNPWDPLFDLVKMENQKQTNDRASDGTRDGVGWKSAGADCLGSRDTHSDRRLNVMCTIILVDYCGGLSNSSIFARHRKMRRKKNWLSFASDSQTAPNKRAIVIEIPQRQGVAFL